MVWLFLFFTFIFLILLCFFSIEFEIKTIINEKQNYAFLIMRLFKGFIKMRYNIEIEEDEKTVFKINLRKTDDKVKSIQEPKELYYKLKKALPAMRAFAQSARYLRSRIQIRNFTVLSHIGIEHEAALTALIVGGLNMITNTALDIVSNKNNHLYRKVVINPVFDRSLFQLDLDCIINIKIGHIIIAGYKMFLQKLRKW